MTPIENRLKELAAAYGQRLHNEGKLAAAELLNARRLQDAAQAKCHAALRAAGNADADTPAQEMVRQAEKEFDEAKLTLGKLELARDHGVNAILRAQEYTPAHDNGGYACPECWVKENLSVGLEWATKVGAVTSYVCRACHFGFSFSSKGVATSE